jgi:isoquinoline 1-oxidoreductase beta subunit
MSDSRKLSRRTFVKASAVVGGGLLVGISIPAARGYAASHAEDDDTVFDSWVRIDPDDRITLMLSKAEMGQGVETALPMLIAEELEADWAKVSVVQADNGRKAYANPLFNMMATGGSTSVRTSWTPLRTVGATARMMLISAAAQRWEVSPSECTASRSVVTHAPSGRTLRYGELATDAAKVTPPKNPPLKAPEHWTLIGSAVPRTDLPQKITGQAKFGIDVQLPNMLYAAVRQCPVFGGRVKRVDDAAARKMPGVRAVHVIDYQTAVIAINMRSLRNAYRFLSSFDQSSFADPRIWKDNSVAVVADSYWQARRALDALSIEWDEGEGATLDDATIEKSLRDGLGEPAGVARTLGDVTTALSKSAKTVEAEYLVPYLAHACMEPMNATAHVTERGADLWGPFQIQGVLPSIVSKMTGVAPSKVRVHTTYLGGGFGRRGMIDFAIQAVQLSQRTGRPVKVVWSREDDIQHDFYRPVSLAKLTAGLDAAGKIVAWKERVVSPSISAFVLPGVPGSITKDNVDPSSVEGSDNKPYVIPNVHVDYVMKQNTVPLGWWRSVGNSQNAFFFESFFDEVAAAAGRDPYELRRELLSEEPRHRAVLELAAKNARWGTPLPAGRARGIAIHESFGSIVAEVAEVSLDERGAVRVHRVTCAVDCGVVVNPDTVRAQMESGIVYGLTAALKGEINIKAGRVVQRNFSDYPMLQMREMPAIDVYIVSSTAAPGGVGEPSTPPIAPAVANAIFALTGVPVRRLPIRKVEKREPALVAG